ncbi:MAG: helix-turn-helix transcriptional regulator [Candidatus Taylorbacteria bacterium]|nr:helix-turn-helix transcriptional regulator [Candidatus Taylorbacteria bacterium]
MKFYPYIYGDKLKELQKDKKIKEWQATLGVNIAMARVHSRLSQKDLADKLGCKQSNIARLENGKSIPSLAYLEKIAEITKCIFVPPSFSFAGNRAKIGR